MAASGLTLQKEPVRDHPDAILVKVDGSIDPKSVTGFKNELQAIAANGTKRFILDCAGLTYVNSSGLAYLLNLVGGVKPKGGMVAMAAVDSKILIIFNMMGITQLFQFYPNALAALRDMDDKLAKELRDVGPALRLEEPPKPVVSPTPRPQRVSSSSSIVGSRTDRIRKGGSTRPVMLVQQENAFVRFFRSLFGLEDSRPNAFRRRR